MNRAIGAAILALSLKDLNKGKGKNNKQFNSLKTRKRTPQTWWNSLLIDEKINAGCVAMHFNLISANYKWKCKDEDMFLGLNKSQQKIVKTIFERKNEPYSIIDIKTVKMNIC